MSAGTPEWRGLSLGAELSVLMSRTMLDGGFDARDNSSFLRFAWRPSTWQQGEGLALRLLPFYSDRLHLGHEAPLAWRGAAAGLGTLVPGADLRLSRETWHAFTSLKGYAGASPTGERDAQYVVFLGGGAAPLPMLQAEASAGYAQQGWAPPQGDAQPQRRDAWAFSGRLLYHHGPVVGVPLDLSRHQGDPARFEDVMQQPDGAPHGFAATVVLDAMRVDNHLPPSMLPMALERQLWSPAIEARARLDSLRGFVRLQSRSLGQVRASADPREPSDSSAPFYFVTDVLVSSEKSARLGLDYSFAKVHLTPGFVGGVRLPATMQRTWFSNERYVVEPSHFHVVADGSEPGPIYSLAATLRFDLPAFSALAEASYDSCESDGYSWSVAVLRGPSEYSCRRAGALQLLTQARF